MLDTANEVLADDGLTRRSSSRTPEVWGVEALSADAVVVRLVVKTVPLQQWKVARDAARAHQGGLRRSRRRDPVPAAHRLGAHRGRRIRARGRRGRGVDARRDRARPTPRGLRHPCPAGSRHRRHRLHRRTAGAAPAGCGVPGTGAWPGTPAACATAPGPTGSRSSRPTRASPTTPSPRSTGVDVAYYLIHALGTGRRFASRDRRTARTFASGGQERGVGRIVYLGGLHPDQEELSPHLQLAREVGEILLTSGVPTAVLQAAVIIGSGSASFEMLRYLTERLPVMTTPRWVSSRIQPIAVRDVLHYLVGCGAHAARGQPRVRHRRAGRPHLRGR